ncbi:zinc-dependent alcohol dehydrogenase [Vallicoccus soli]|uniref:zinc-dependent alcohol dehydrogenase n=1 Tax=Vallicoccus soli TaxID=2339232 RepID=UPI001C49BC34|nr:zinc-binding alcohol dehydrogenase [Vallicoccus soli]
MTRTVEVLQVTGPGEVAWVPVGQGPLAEGSVRVDTLASGVSAGTELTFLKGTNPALTRTWDGTLGLFRDGGGAPAYPVRKLGYMQVGRVVESRSPHLPEGAAVAATYGHATGHDLDPLAERAVVLPEGLDPVLGTYVAHMGPICANGLLHAAEDLLGAGAAAADLGAGVRGRRVVVTGAGVVGLLTGLLAAHHGAAEVAVADPTPERLAAAAGLGLVPVDTSSTDLGTWAKERWRHAAGDRGADLVLQGRGQAAALHDALRALRPQGTVVDLAFYPGGAGELRLGEEFHHNGLRLVCAQIGRVPRGLGHAWDRERLSAATVDLLLARGAAVREHLVSDLVPLAEAPALYADLAARRRHVLQAVLVAPGVPGLSATTP